MSEGVDVTRELLAAGLVGVGFLLVFAIAELWRRVGNPPVEWTRKLVHFCGGLIAATFPWVFHTRWSVVMLSVVFGLILWGSRRLGLLASVHSVERKSEGGFWYPVAVLLVYLLARGQPVFYLISILALVVADALAAVLGAEYGRRIYTVETDRRSLEGSAVFFFATFLIAHLPLLLLTRIDPPVSVLVALQIAVIVTQFEAISLRGNDNLLVPLATYFLLIKLTPRSVEHLVHQIGAQFVIIAVIGAAALAARSLTFSGSLALMLFMYGLYSLGGPEWVVAPGVAFATFLGVREAFARGLPIPSGSYQVAAIFYVCIVGTLLFLANNALETMIPGVGTILREGDPLYVPFIAVVSAQFAMILIAQFQPFEEAAPAWTPRSGTAITLPLLLVALPGLLVGPDGLTPWGMLLAIVTTAASSAAYVFARRRPWWPHRTPWNLRLQALSAATVAAAVVPAHLWWIGALD